ncbi:MAG: hemerythrin domain-containing protein [Acidobacteriota bacterium]
MRSSKRENSLIPLSRQHHYALLLCLRIHRGLPQHQDDIDWLKAKAANVVQFFQEDLLMHFIAEEEILFPVMRNFADSIPILLTELSQEHDKLELLIEGLRQGQADQLFHLLKEFADLLEAHIRKEERILFPLYEKQISEPLARNIEGDIVEYIGTAMQPANPALLE